VHQKELNMFKDILIKRKEKILKSLSQLEENTSKGSRGTALEGSGIPTHIAELGTDVFEKNLDLDLTSSEVELLQMIEESLKKIETKKYGICESCNKPIPKARLHAVPYTKYCIKCQKQREETNQGKA